MPEPFEIKFQSLKGKNSFNLVAQKLKDNELCQF